MNNYVLINSSVFFLKEHTYNIVYIPKCFKISQMYHFTESEEKKI